MRCRQHITVPTLVGLLLNSLGLSTALGITVPTLVGLLLDMSLFGRMVVDTVPTLVGFIKMIDVSFEVLLLIFR